MRTHPTTKNLSQLCTLRTIAMMGQVVAIAVVTHWLQIPLMLKPLAVIISLSAILNLLTCWRLMRTTSPIDEREFFLHLLLDMAALGALLYYTGGATNPFTSLFILQVVLAAVTLPARYTWSMAGLAITSYTALMVWKVDVPYMQHHHLGDFFSFHVQGMWISFMLLACIVAWFVVRMHTVIRRQDALLADAEKVAAMGALATSAAHALGTPLATISVLAEQCEPHLAGRLQTQIARCKEMLSQITEAGGVARAESSAPIQLDRFFEALLHAWQHDHPDVKCEADFSRLTPERLLVEQGFSHAIVNLLDNAADASPAYVGITAAVNAGCLTVSIADRGEGIAVELQRTLGKAGVSNKPDGLGLGVFLAKSVITRMGGTLTLTNAIEGGGAVAIISLPMRGLTL
jgi:two-component system, sensor histidine kinase RegB